MAIIWLKLCVQVLIQIHLIGKRMNTIPVISVIVDEFDGYLVQSNLEKIAIKDDFSISEEAANFKRGNLLSIDNYISDICTVEVKEYWLLFGTRDFIQIKCNSCLSKI